MAGNKGNITGNSVGKETNLGFRKHFRSLRKRDSFSNGTFGASERAIPFPAELSESLKGWFEFRWHFRSLRKGGLSSGGAFGASESIIPFSVAFSEPLKRWFEFGWCFRSLRKPNLVSRFFGFLQEIVVRSRYSPKGKNNMKVQII